MTEQALPENRWHTIQQLWRDFPWLYTAPGIVIGIVIGFLFGVSATGTIENFGAGLLSFLDGIWAEALGITFTVFLIDRISESRATKREETRRIRERNELLVRQIGSSVNAVAKNAVDEAQRLNLLEGEYGILKGQELNNADLTNVYLRFANLQDSNLAEAKLENTDLISSNLQNAHLRLAKLQGSDLWKSNLNGADLREAELNGAIFQHCNLADTNLQDAKLQGANLRGANLVHTNLRFADLSDATLEETDLTGANLERANLQGATFENACFRNANLKYAKFGNMSFDDFMYMFNNILPDGSRYTQDTDMTRYINPDHPDFWQPDWVKAGFDTYGDWLEAGSPKPDNDPDSPTKNQ